MSEVQQSKSETLLGILDRQRKLYVTERDALQERIDALAKESDDLDKQKQEYNRMLRALEPSLRILKGEA